MSALRAYAGLSLHPGAPAFLASAYGLVFEGVERCLPLYRDRRGIRYWGGYGSVYVFVDDATAVESAGRSASRERGLLESCISVSHYGGTVRHLNPVLELPANMHADARLALYERNIKKHIRNTIMHSPLRYVWGTVPVGWVDLHRRVMGERGRSAHDADYFSALSRSFGSDVTASAAYDGNDLVGALVCVRSGAYIHLLSIATDRHYRAHRVDSGLYDEAVRYALAEGVRLVDFGLTDARAATQLAYKRAFGAIPRALLTQTFGTPAERLGASIRRAVRAVGRLACRGAPR